QLFERVNGSPCGLTYLRRRPTTIDELAKSVLNADEVALAERLEYLITEGETRKAQSLLAKVFPKYWKDDSTSLFPVSIYRTIYYLDFASDYIGDTRHLIENMGQHLEGLLNQLVRQKGLPVKQELGMKVEVFRETLGEELSSALHDFNRLIHNVSKHPDDDPLLPVRFDV